MKKRNLLSAVLAAVLALGTVGALPQNAELAAVAVADTIGGEWLYEDNSDGSGGIVITSYGGNDENVVIPDEFDGKPVTSIGYYAFDHCKFIKSVTIPDTVIKFHPCAFYGCGFETFTVPANVKEIGNHALDGCNDLKEILVEPGNNYFSSRDGSLYSADGKTLLCYPSGKGGEFKIPDDVTEIAFGAFSNNRGVTKIILPDGIETIDDGAIAGCNNLSEIVINNGKYYIVENGVLFNKDKTKLVRYPQGKADTAYTIPESVTEIGAYAFFGSGNLTNITIPDSVSKIGQEAFWGCSALAEITLPQGIQTMETQTLAYCSSLKSVVVPEGVTSLYMAFDHCYSLNSVTIPASVTYIGDGTFDECDELETVIFGGTEEEWDAIELSDYRNESLYYATIKFSDGTQRAGEPREPGPEVFDDPVIKGEDTLDKETKEILNGIEVINDNGAFGSGVVMNVSATNKTESSFSFDITFTKNGREVQPKGKVTVRVPIPEGMKDLEKLYVYHEDKHGIISSVDFKIEDGYVVFEADSFSEYTLSAEELETEAEMTAQTTVDGETVDLTIDKNGKVDVSGLENGEYIFTFSKKDHTPRDYKVTVTDGDLTGIEDGVKLHRLGDINGDGFVNTQDVAKANAHVKGTALLEDYDLACINVNQDENINVQDVALMNAHAKNTKLLW